MSMWRNPDALQDSCCSKTYNSYSRIDYFLISAGLLSKIHDCNYNGILISDHATNNLIYVDPRLLCDPPKMEIPTKMASIY